MNLSRGQSLIILFCIFLLCFSLYSDGLAGLSDNCDFERVMRPNRIFHADGQRTPFIFERYYKLTFEGNTKAEKLYNMLFTIDEPYYTTHNIVIKLSLLANLIGNVITGSRLEGYDIFWLGFIYLIAFSGALTVIILNINQKPALLKVFFCTALAIVFCDIGYAAWFNSFYGEPLQMVSLLWIFASVAGVITSEHNKMRYATVFYISILVFSGAKFANIPIGILFSISGLAFFPYFKNSDWKRFAFLSFLVFTILSGRILYENVPEGMEKQTTYQSVFYGILKGSSTPQEDLRQLDLPEEYASLSNTNAYMTNYSIDIKSRQFEEQFYDRISKFDVLKFYLKNPRRFMEKIRISLLNSSHIRPVYLSNYGMDHDRLKLKKDIGLWSNIRLSLPFDSMLFVFAVFLLSCCAVLKRLLSMIIKKSFEAAAIAGIVFPSALIGMNLMNLVIPVIANGEADLQKHMFAYVMGFDLQILLLTLHIIRQAFEKVNQGKEFIIKLCKNKKQRYSLLAAAMLLASIPVMTLLTAKKPPQPLTPGSLIYFGNYSRSDNRSPVHRGHSTESMTLEAVLCPHPTPSTSIPWLVIRREGSTLQLLSKNPITFSPFSTPKTEGDSNRQKYGSNLWPDSDLRSWLNNDFLACFSPEEQNLIKPTENRVILSSHDKGLAQTGASDFFWTHIPTMVDLGAQTAYAMIVRDKFFLLDVSEFSEYIAKPGLEPNPNTGYWLETPYYGNSSMVRVIEKDGYVYMKDACYEKMGVRPSVIIDISKATFKDGLISAPKEDIPY